jgi:hypothetical protein
MAVNQDNLAVREKKRLIAAGGVVGYLVGLTIACTFFWAVPFYSKIYWP